MTTRTYRLKLLAAILHLVAMAAPQTIVASIIQISIAPNSQANSRPTIDNLYNVQAQGGVFNDNRGIGIIIKPTFVSANDQTDFALHQNGNLFGPSAYGGFVPNPATSSVLYQFDHATIVSGVEIIQHYNGVTGIGGHLGNSLGSLNSLGSILGSSSMTDGTSSFYNFGNTALAGTYFDLTIDRTLLSYAFAIHRAYLLDENGNRILGLNNPIGVPDSGSTLLLLGGCLAGLFVFRRNLGRAGKASH